MSEILKELNNIKNIQTEGFKKQCLRLSDIPLNQQMRILKAERKDTMFGPKIMLEVEEHVLFLPKRYNELSDKALEAMGKGSFTLEKKCMAGNRIDFEFYNTDKKTKEIM